MGLMAKRQALNRLGQPEDVANAAVIRGSDQSAQLTGLKLMIGGASAHACLDQHGPDQRSILRRLKRQRVYARRVPVS